MPEIPTNIKSKKLVEKRREQIINAATRLFASKGFYRTTLRELAEEAGISHGNIYDYVGTKEDILFLVHNYMTSQILKVLDESVEDIDDPVEKLKRLIASEVSTSYIWRQATLMVYQEGKVLKKERLKEFLKIERDRLERFESVIEKCIQHRKCRNVDPRLVSNLIKVMADVWPLKSWDLKGHTTKYRIEKTIMDAVFNGILKIDAPEFHDKFEHKALAGQSVLLVNGGTLLGMSLCNFMLSKGAAVVNYVLNDPPKANQSYSITDEFPEKISMISHGEAGSLNSDLFNRILADSGTINHLVYNWEFICDNNTPAVPQVDLMDQKFRDALALVPDLQEALGKGKSGRILHIAPSFWDRNKDGLLYESVKARLVAVTRQLSAEFADAGINVNCVIPGFIDGIQPPHDEAEQAFDDATPIHLKCIGKQEDLLAGIFFFLSDSSRYVSGQVLEISGGRP